jgi:hypothetical protein
MASVFSICFLSCSRCFLCSLIAHHYAARAMRPPTTAPTIAAQNSVAANILLNAKIIEFGTIVRSLSFIGSQQPNLIYSSQS